MNGAEGPEVRVEQMGLGGYPEQAPAEIEVEGRANAEVEVKAAVEGKANAEAEVEAEVEAGAEVEVHGEYQTSSVVSRAGRYCSASPLLSPAFL